MDITWRLQKFTELSTIKLYSILQLRQNVFVVEQNCPYLDCDNKDQHSHHLIGMVSSASSSKLIAYLRIVAPQNANDAPHIGRVVCDKHMRQSGIGKELVQQGILHCTDLFPAMPIKISAQQYLITFYTNLGFIISSPPYEEDGIPHVGMTYARHL